MTIVDLNPTLPPAPAPLPAPVIQTGTPDSVPEHNGVDVIQPVVAREDDDIDMIELRAAQAAAALPVAAPAVAAPTVPPAPVATGTPAPVTATPDQATKPGRAPMLPKPRVDEMVARARAEGRAEALTEVLQTGGTHGAPRAPAAPPVNVDPSQPIPADAPISAEVAHARLANIDAAKLALAEQFDDGKIGMKEFKQAEVALDQEARQHSLRISQSMAPAAAVPDVNNDITLDQETAKLETAHPYVTAIPATDVAAWQLIESRAEASLKAQGIKLPVDRAGNPTPTGMLVLRTEMAKQTDILGPTLTGKTREQITGRPAAPATVPTSPPALTPAQQATRTALARAAQHPIDIATMGTPAGPLAAPTDADIMAMTQEQIEALPAAQRMAILNRSG